VELERLIAGLSQPRAYPYAVASVDMRQTHISVVARASACRIARTWPRWNRRWRYRL